MTLLANSAKLTLMRDRNSCLRVGLLPSQPAIPYHRYYQLRQNPLPGPLSKRGVRGEGFL